MNPSIKMRNLTAAASFRARHLICIAGLAALLCPASHAETIYSDSADLSLKFDRTDGMTISSNGPGEAALNVGKSGAAAGFDRAAVVVFQIPDLGVVDNPFGTASLGLYLNQDTVNDAVNGDLYGLGRREFPDVEFDDYYGRDNTPDPTDATLLQDDFLTPDGLTLNSLVSTSVGGSEALADYLNVEYEGGLGVGQYVFLRVNTDADTTQRWSFVSSNGTNGDLTQTPQITYILASEPVDTIRVESLSNGSGTTIPAQTLVAGETLTSFAIARDAGGTFIDNVAVNWELSNSTDGIAPTDLAVAGDNKSATFTANAPGTTEISIIGNAANLIGTGTITVIAGPASQVLVETSPDGTGVPIADTPLVEGAFVEGFAVSRDASGNFIASVSAVWTLEEVTGGIIDADLAPAGDGTSAVFTANGNGSARIRASVDGLTAIDSGVISVSELVYLWDGGGGNSNWSTSENWFADTLPPFDNTTDLICHDPAITRLNLYLGADRTARSLTYNADADRNFNIRLTQTGVTDAANFIFDTDSVGDPAELVVDADAAGNFKLGNIVVDPEREHGSIILADDLLIDHNGTGTLTLDGDIAEADGVKNLTKAGTGTLIMTGNNSYTGNTTVSAGVLSINGTSLSDVGSLVIGEAIVEVDGDELVGNLFLDGVKKAAGIYGSSLSAAPLENQDDTRFSGTGIVTVAGVSAGATEIVSITFDGTNVTLKWTSTPGEEYDVFSSFDLKDFEREVQDSIPAAAAGGETELTFPILSVGADIQRAFFIVVPQ